MASMAHRHDAHICIATDPQDQVLHEALKKMQLRQGKLETLVQESLNLHHADRRQNIDFRRCTTLTLRNIQDRSTRIEKDGKYNSKMLGYVVDYFKPMNSALRGIAGYVTGSAEGIAKLLSRNSEYAYASLHGDDIRREEEDKERDEIARDAEDMDSRDEKMAYYDDTTDEDTDEEVQLLTPHDSPTPPMGYDNDEAYQTSVQDVSGWFAELDTQRGSCYEHYPNPVQNAFL